MGPDIDVRQLALMLSRAPRLGPRAAYSILTRLGSGPSVLTSSADELRKAYRLHPDAAEYLAANTPDVLAQSSELLDKVTGLGIHVITVLDNDYPASLRAYGRLLPPVIYAYGNVQLLRERKFAIVNSSSFSGRGAAATSEIAGLLIEEGLTLVTSHNNASYQLSLLSAKRRRAPLVIVLDRGIINAFHGLMDWQPVATARIWDPQFDPQRDLVVSQFRLGDRWIGENSRLRDRMVFGLADVVIAVEIRAGGVMEKECLSAKQRGRELYVCSFGSDNPAGNTSLIQAGCQQLIAADIRSQLISMCVAPTFEGRTNDLAEEDDTPEIDG